MSAWPVIRPRPAIPVNRLTASVTGKTSSGSGWACSREVNRRRLVTKTQTSGAGGYQWADLVRGAGVVEQDQHAFAGQLAAIERGHVVDVGGDLLTVDVQCPQQPFECLARFDRGDRGCVSVQVDEQAPVGEICGELVGGVHGQRGLAHSSDAGYRHNRGVEALLTWRGQN